MALADALLAFLKRHALVLGPLALLGLFGATVASLELTSLTPFCNTCHSMGTVYAQWERSSHASPTEGTPVGCSDCHVRDGVVGLVSDHIVNGTFQLFAEFGQGRVPSRPVVCRSMHDERCVACHRDAPGRDGEVASDRLPPSLAAIGLVVPHRSHYAYRSFDPAEALRLVELRGRMPSGDGVAASPLTPAEVDELEFLGKVERGSCGGCHEREVRLPDGRVSWPPDRSVHLDQPMTCVACHEKVVHADARRHGRPIPDRETCAVCHTGEYHGRLGVVFPVACETGTNPINCIKCHPRDRAAILEIVRARTAGTDGK